MNGSDFPLLLGVAEYAEQFMRALELKGDLPREIDPKYKLTLQALDLAAPEFYWLRRGGLWETGGTQNAVAAEFPIFAFYQRSGVSGRNTMAIVEQVVISNTNAAAQTFEYGVTFAGVGGVANNRTTNQRDDRQFGSQASFGAGTGTNAVNPIGSSHNIVTLAAGTSFTDVGPWVLTGASNGVFTSAFIVVGSAVNQALRVGVKWRERTLSTSEV